MKAYYKWILILSLLALTAMGLPARGKGEAPQKPDVATASSGDRKTVTDHAGNTVDIPKEPKRIASLHTMSTTAMLWDLEAPLIGTATRTLKEENRPYIRSVEEIYEIKFQDTDLANYGSFGEDVEQIKASEPDLIIGTVTNLKAYDSLSAIAPTVLIDHYSANLWRAFEDVAKWVGKGAEFKRKKAAYSKRLAQVRAKFSKAPSSQTVAYAMPRPAKAQYSARPHYGAFTVVAYDLGFKPLPFMLAQFEESSSKGGNLSAETFGQYNPDWLLSTFRNQTGETAETIYAGFDDIAPGWREYNSAYKNDQIILINREKSYPLTFKALDWLLDQFEQMAK